MYNIIFMLKTWNLNRKFGNKKYQSKPSIIYFFTGNALSIKLVVRWRCTQKMYHMISLISKIEINCMICIVKFLEWLCIDYNLCIMNLELLITLNCKTILIHKLYLYKKYMYNSKVNTNILSHILNSSVYKLILQYITYIYGSPQNVNKCL